MRRPLRASLALCSLLVVGCGAARENFSGRHRAAAPVNLSVYVDNSHLQLSPARVGAGLVSFDVVNQASKTERIVVTRLGGRAVARTGSIAARSTAQLTVDFTRGRYELAAREVCSTCNDLLATSTTPAMLTIGPARTAGDSALLQP